MKQINGLLNYTEPQVTVFCLSFYQSDQHVNAGQQVLFSFILNQSGYGLTDFFFKLLVLFKLDMNLTDIINE